MSRMLTNAPVFHNGHGTTAEDRFLHYKSELHQQLIAGMDLSAIGTMDEDELRAGGPPGRRGALPAAAPTCST